MTSTQKFLRQAGTASLPERLQPFSPSDYYQNALGLYVWDGARRSVESLKAVGPVPALEIRFFDLVRNANDREIRSELPTEHVFSEEVFWPHFTGMIERQWGGEEGPLLTNSRVNIFYICDKEGGVSYVSASWYLRRCRWGVNARVLNDIRSVKFSRVFSSE